MLTRTIVRSTRAFSTSPVARKSTVEAVKEAADVVNKKVGKGLASAIDKGEVAAEKTKEALGKCAGAKDAQHKVDKAARATKDTASSAAEKTTHNTNEAKRQAEKRL